MTDWQQRWEAGDTPWDHGEATPVLAEIEEKLPGLLAGQRVLVPGCGSGHDARWLGKAGAQVLGVDLAAGAVTRARELTNDARVQFALGDFLEPKAEWVGQFDLVFEHTCFCAMEPEKRPAYIAAAGQVLRPGGRVVDVFYMEPELAPGETGPPFGSEVAELETLWKSGGFQLEDSWVPERGFEKRLGRERVMIWRSKSIE